MKKWIINVFLVAVLCGLGNGKVRALDYEINNFESQIRLQQDSSLLIVEKIETNFLVAKHGIFRVIPYIYSHSGKTIRAELSVVGIKDGLGKNIPFTIENYNQSKRIKIGDANLTILGPKDFIIEYKVNNVVLDYGEGPEIYWNVTGEEWEVPINKAKAIVDSPFGKITKTECFGCSSSFDESRANFEGAEGLTIVVQIDKNNLITMPTEIEKKVKEAKDNWGYLVGILPLIILSMAWYVKGRDKRYLTENVFYQPEKRIEKTTSLLSRPHLPLVYGPIDGLTPSEVGTILDEKLDTKDVVAEIIELARLGYLTIKKIENKGLFGITTRDYELNRTKKISENLTKFQENLLKDLFEGSITIKNILSQALKNKDGIYEAFNLKKEGEVQEAITTKISGIGEEMLKEKNTVLISDLKNHFYTHLSSLRSEMYRNLANKKMTEGNLDSTRSGWIAIGILLNFAAAVVIFIFFVSITENFGPMMILLTGLIPTMILAGKMPRKTAWGYSLHRQTIGLKYYLSKGKWREEIAEKKLFLEEMLPLAIALGVVNQLAEDMKDLEIEPPKYFQGMAINSFASDLSHFNSAAAAGLVTSPSSSGSSSWSGGSGFSGGGGGGFGGGGGGSW